MSLKVVKLDLFANLGINQQERACDSLRRKKLIFRESLRQKYFTLNNFFVVSNVE